MEATYFYSAVIGGSLLVLQLLLLLFGGDHPADADLDADLGSADGGDHFDSASDANASFLKLLSLKAIVAFATFFGLAGLASLRGALSTELTLVISCAAGSSGFLIVAYLMAALAKLNSRGNLDLHNAVGLHAKVYVRVPGEHRGTGRVSLALQGRRVECKAITAGPELASGCQVQVVDSNVDSLVVAAIDS